MLALLVCLLVLLLVLLLLLLEVPLRPEAASVPAACSKNCDSIGFKTSKQHHCTVGSACSTAGSCWLLLLLEPLPPASWSRRASTDGYKAALLANQPAFQEHIIQPSIHSCSPACAITVLMHCRLVKASCMAGEDTLLPCRLR